MSTKYIEYSNTTSSSFSSFLQILLRNAESVSSIQAAGLLPLKLRGDQLTGQELAKEAVRGGLARRGHIDA